MNTITRLLKKLKPPKKLLKFIVPLACVVGILMLILTFTVPKVLNSSGGKYRQSTDEMMAYNMPASAPVGMETVGGRGNDGFAVHAQRNKAEYYAAEDKIARESSISSSSRGDIFSAPAYGATEILKPQIIKTASLTLEVENIVDSVKLVENLTTGHGGLITHKEVSITGANNQYRSGNMQVRVPQTQLDNYLAALHTLGIPRQENVSSQDVGAEMIDLKSRVRNAEAQENLLLGIMNRAGKIPEVLQVSNELARVRESIEQMQGRLNHLSQQVAYSTVNIQLTEKALVSPTQGKPNFFTVIGNSAKRAFGDLIDFINAMAAMLTGMLVFWVPVLLVLWIVGRLLWRFLLKRPVQAVLVKLGDLFKEDNNSSST